jgi:small nuclear ribonucleoprotein (snRNP)-like protein
MLKNDRVELTLNNGEKVKGTVNEVFNYQQAVIFWDDDEISCEMFDSLTFIKEQS